VTIDEQNARLLALRKQTGQDVILICPDCGLSQWNRLSHLCADPVRTAPYLENAARDPMSAWQSRYGYRWTERRERGAQKRRSRWPTKRKRSQRTIEAANRIDWEIEILRRTEIAKIEKILDHPRYFVEEYFARVGDRFGWIRQIETE
jgi:hypothetical protein